jgi:hypothetical protein
MLELKKAFPPLALFEATSDTGTGTKAPPPSHVQLSRPGGQGLFTFPSHPTFLGRGTGVPKNIEDDQNLKA